MKCYECGGPCRKSDTKMLGRRIGSGVVRRKDLYKKHRVCDFCQREVKDPYAYNVLRESIRRNIK